VDHRLAEQASLLDPDPRRRVDLVALRIVSRVHRLLFRGPYFWTTSKGQTVYRVTVEDKPGGLRTGWVRCGGWWLGLMSNHVEACWDETPSQGVAVPRDRWLDD